MLSSLLSFILNVLYIFNSSTGGHSWALCKAWSFAPVNLYIEPKNAHTFGKNKNLMGGPNSGPSL